MSVKKIFITLVVIVACVMIGALVLNVLLPNVTKSLINSAEDMIYNATKMSFDFNGDSDAGGTTAGDYSGGMQGNNIKDNGAAVDGFQNGSGSSGSSGS